MARYAARRLLLLLPVVLSAAVVTFALLLLLPGDPAVALLGQEASPEELSRFRHLLGLDRPVLVQLGLYLWRVARADFGRSITLDVPVLRLILSTLPATLELATASIVVAVLAGIPLGLLAGLNPDSRASRVIMTGTVIGFSLPSFWKGMMLVLLFSVALGWLPTAGRGETVAFLGIQTSLFTTDGLRHLILPSLNLAIPNMALMIRLVAAGTTEAMTQDYVKFARAKGVRRRRIVGRHVLRNILIPVVTVVGIEFGSLVAFSTITETVFSWPGMGKLLIDSIYQLDRPVVVAYVMLATLLFVAVNFIVDVLYAVLDPRVKLSGDMV